MILETLLALGLLQTHPCDVTPQPVQTKSGFTVGACHSGKDEDGNPATLTAVKVFIDGTLVRTATPAASGAPNATGLTYYTIANVAASRGSHTLTVTVVSADGESVPSDPYTFSVVGGKPAKPHGARLEPR